MTTPVDAMPFSEVKAELARRGVNTSSLIEKQEFQDALRAARYYENPDANVFCKKCGSGDDEEGNDILMCEGDGCKAAYHLQCLPTPLSQVPDGEWLCEACSAEATRPVAAMKLSEVKAELLRRGVSTAGLLEKQELFEALLKAREGGDGAKRPTADDVPAEPPGKPPKRAKSKRPVVDDDASDDSSKRPGAVADASAGPYAGWRRKRSAKKNEGRYYLVSPDGKTKVWEDTLDPAEQPGKPTNPTKAQKRQRDEDAGVQPQPSAQVGDLASEVEVVVRGHDLETLTPKMVRAELEERLSLPAGSLKPQKDTIGQHIDRVLRTLKAEGEAQRTPEYGV